MMADKRKNKQVVRRKEDPSEKPTKEEYAVAKHLRFNLPAKEGKLVGMSVQYFIACKAIDSLLDSKFGAKSKSEPLFTSRASCVDFLDRLLQKKFFHRAAKVEKKKETDKKRKKLKDGEMDEGSFDDTKKDKKSKKLKDDNKKDDVPDSSKEKEKESDDDKKDEEKRKKRKLKLEMHDNQVFKDGPEVYVWIYDPVPVKTFIIGLFLVLGAIGVCLFPLWPPEVRFGVYYISVAAAGFVGVILSLCIIRFILFCLIWAVSMGRHHFWFLPNLTEDVGFFESFRPIYKHEYFGNVESIDDKSNDENIEESTNIEESPNIENIPTVEEPSNEKPEGEESESENDNGYEIVDKNELEVNESENEVNYEKETDNDVHDFDNSNSQIDRTDQKDSSDGESLEEEKKFK